MALGFLWIKQISKCGMVRCPMIQHRYASSYYETLGVPNDATSAHIKKNYYEKCKMLHPDKTYGREDLQEQFIHVKKAYETLKMQDTRREYDSYLKSLDRSQHDFHEWKAYGKPGSSNDRDYTKYNTAPHATNVNQGTDTKWSDFTLSDVLAYILLATMAIYVVVNERKLAKENRPRPHARQVQVLMNVPGHTAVKPSSSDINGEKHEPQTNVKSVITKEQGTDAKPLKKSPNVFEDIKSTGHVSDDTLKSIKEKYQSFPHGDINKTNLKTWTKPT